MTGGRQSGRKRTKTPDRPDHYFEVPASVPEDIVPVAEEVSRMEERARWSSQSQFEAGKFWGKANMWLGVPASILGLAAGGSAVTEALPPLFVAVLALAGAALASVMTFVGAERRAQHARACANAYHDIQDDARRLLTISIATMKRSDADESLAGLVSRYKETRETADIVS